MQFLSATRLNVVGRRNLAILMTCLLVAVALGGIAAIPSHAQTDSWTSPSVITPSGSDAINPGIAIDSTGVSHVVYQETNFSSFNRVWYLNDIGGSWNNPVRLSNADNTIDPAISTVTVDGVVYVDVVYGSSNRLYYRRSSDGGRNWGGEERITSHSSFGPSIILDDTATPHIAYTRGGKVGGDDVLDVYYLTRSGGNWQSSGNLSTADDINTLSTIAYNRDGNGDLSVHILYKGAPWNKRGDVLYLKRERGSWSPPLQYAGSDAGEPDMVSDTRSSLYATLVSKRNSSLDYEAYFYRSTDNGENWSNPQTVGAGTSDLTRESSIAYLPGGLLAVVTSDDYFADRNNIYARISLNNGSSWSNRQEVFVQGGISLAPEVAAGAGRFQTVWFDNANGKFRIFTSTYGDVRPPSPEGSIAVSGDLGEGQTKTTSVDVTFNINNGDPDQYQLSNDGQNWSQAAALPTDNVIRGWQIPAASGVACETRTIYGRLIDSAEDLSSDVLTAQVVHDPGVAASVTVRNPFMYQNVSTAGNVQDLDGSGAFDGDTRYTRDSVYFVGVSQGVGECHPPITANLGTLTIPEGGTLFPFTASDLNEDGTVDVTVVVKDSVEHSSTETRTLIYDDEAPQILNPQTVSEGGVSFYPVDANGEPLTEPSDSVLVQMRVQNLQVTDNEYGTNGENKNWWGFWMGNMMGEAPGGDQMGEMTWLPREISSATEVGENTYDLTFTHNVVSGVVNPIVGGQEQDYYVCMRVLDGAGNPSVETICSGPITLSEDARFPTTNLPLILN